LKKIAVLLAEGFEEVEAVTPIDFLRRAEIDVVTAGISGKSLTGGHAIVINADVHIGDISESADEFDGVIIPGGMPGAQNIVDSKEASEFIKTMMESGKLVAAICAAPAVVLTPLGVIKGKKATCYPGFEEKFTNATFEPGRVVVDGNVITSRSPGTAAEFAVAIIRYLIGDDAADYVHKRTLQK